MGIRKIATVLLAGLVLMAGCDGEENSGSNGPPDYGDCIDRPFSVSPVPSADIRSIAPLGNLNPPGHVMPTAHMYFYLQFDGGNQSVVTALRAPGDFTVTLVRAAEHVGAGFRDYALTGVLCDEVYLVFGHVASLSAEFFGDTTQLDDWDFAGEYSVGGETYRNWERWFNFTVSAGDSLGTAGGNPGQWALDFGIHDSRFVSGTMANPARWRDAIIHAACVLDYYQDGAVLDELADLIDREEIPGDPHPCGAVLQDIPGTAHGAWFLDGTPNPQSQDNELALVWHNTRPSQAVISVGNAVPTVGSNAYAFAPADSGRLNRPFSTVTAASEIHGYQFAVYDGVILLQMADATTLWLEGIAGGSVEPETWAFTGQKSVFVR